MAARLHTHPGMRSSAWWVLALVAVGCAPAGADDASSDDTSSAITRGAEDRATKAVVALEIGNEDGSGVVIAPGVVLTAAHVVHPSFVGNYTYVYISNAPDLATAKWLRVARQNVHIHPSFDPAHAGQGHDFAIVTFPRADLDVTPIPLRLTSLDDSIVNAPLRIVGYGMTRPRARDAGTRRSASTVVRSIEEQLLVVGRQGDAQQCHGDSGGPALVTTPEGERVVAIASFVLASDPSCWRGSYSGRVDANLDFIAPFLPLGAEAADGGAPDAALEASTND